MENDTLNHTHEELQRARNELALLYEISNAMHTTLKPEEILYIILTAVTAHVGLGFNRAILFLVNEKEGILEGKMGIGPDSGEEANRIWTHVEQEKMNLEDLINNYKVSGQLSGSQLNRIVKSIRLPLAQEEGGILTMTLLDGMPLHINPQTMAAQKQDTLINILKSEEFISVPLKAKDKIIGVLFADNPYTHKPITSDDIRVLTMFANQAGLAIENSQLYEKTLLKSHTDSLTGRFLAGAERIEMPGQRRKPNGKLLTIHNPREHNLKGMAARIPLGTFTCITGVSGSGKSTLVNDILYRALAQMLHRAQERPGAHDRVEGAQHLDKVIDIDQSPIGRTPRSNPATYTGVFTLIRTLMARTSDARMRGYQPGTALCSRCFRKELERDPGLSEYVVLDGRRIPQHSPVPIWA